jgi:hypothetical protein
MTAASKAAAQGFTAARSVAGEASGCAGPWPPLCFRLLRSAEVTGAVADRFRQRR